MATLPNTHAAYFTSLRMKVYNPGGKFVTPADEVQALNEAAITVASRLGGISFIDTTGLTVAAQADYTLANNLRVIRGFEIIDNTVSPGAYNFVDVVPYKQFRALNYGSPSQFQFAYYMPELNRLHIEPAPTQAGDTLALLCWGIPNVLVDGAITLYDADPTQIAAITTEAASILRIKTRNINESGLLHQRAKEEIENAAIIESMKNMSTKVAVGRHEPLTRLRRV